MKSVQVCLLLSALCGLSAALKLPTYIKPCPKDANFNKCALEHGKAAIPKILKGDGKYRIPNMQPLEVEKIVVGDGPDSKIGLQLVCEKCKFYGLEGVQLEDIKFDFEKKRVFLQGRVPKVQMKGKYKASGKVLVLPITGDGDADINLTNVGLKYNADFEVEKKNGKDHLKLVNPVLDIETDGINFKLTNLFNGDKLLGDNMNTFLNENWKELLKEFGPAVSETLAQIITLIVNNIAELVPYEDVFSH
ncbi:hypothetical protein LSTR_LSTR013931 [Laodelphax striatellus]|uniref:Uncharacterized protein n=1 Tax=Laodelphax striatellus TaxID=195883 RepID=A0A482XSD4_LAOST|nr:hypothetical protein LSTR_LSTR013931 [Laodelphax striatellus]